MSFCNPVDGEDEECIIFWPVINPWSAILIVLVVVETLPAVKAIPVVINFLFGLLYLTLKVVEIDAFTSTKIVSSVNNPCVPAAETVTRFFSTLPVIVVGYEILKLWIEPVPNPTKYTNPWWRVVDAIPTKVPVVPSPTRTVDNPILSSSNFAINKDERFVKGIEDPALTVEIPIVDPPLVWYVTLSPVSNPCRGKYIVWVGTKRWVIPAPGFAKESVFPIPMPDVVPILTDSIGSK